jgi:hypothetical protein
LRPAGCFQFWQLPDFGISGNPGNPFALLSSHMTTVTQSPLTTIADIGRHDGQSVTIQGWLYNKRESGKLIFPIFRDGTGVIQGGL